MKLVNKKRKSMNHFIKSTWKKEKSLKSGLSIVKTMKTFLFPKLKETKSMKIMIISITTSIKNLHKFNHLLEIGMLYL